MRGGELQRGKRGGGTSKKLRASMASAQLKRAGRSSYSTFTSLLATAPSTSSQYESPRIGKHKIYVNLISADCLGLLWLDVADKVCTKMKYII